MGNEDYTYLQLDFIKELANVGGGNAATSISQLVDKPIDMAVPTNDILNYNEVYEKIMSADTIVNSVITRMLGDAEGIFLFVATEETSEKLVEMMMPAGIPLSAELETSAIIELVNILVTSFLNAISKMVGANVISSVPLMVKDMFGAILSSVYIESEQYDDRILIIKNEFFYKGNKLEASLYFVPKPQVLEKLFKIIGV